MENKEFSTDFTLLGRDPQNADKFLIEDNATGKEYFVKWETLLNVFSSSSKNYIDEQLRQLEEKIKTPSVISSLTGTQYSLYNNRLIEF